MDKKFTDAEIEAAYGSSSAPVDATSFSDGDIAGAWAETLGGKPVDLLGPTLDIASKSNPDKEATWAKLARDLEIPLEAVRAAPDVAISAYRYKKADPQKLVSEAPATAGWLANPDNALLASDDVPNLADVERRITNLQKAKKGELPSFAEMPRPGAGLMNDIRYMHKSFADSLSLTALKVIWAKAEGKPTYMLERDLHREKQAVAEARPEGMGTVEDFGVDVGTNLLRNTPGMALGAAFAPEQGASLLLRGAAMVPGLGVMAGQVLGDSYAKYRDMGLEHESALMFAAADAAAEFVGEVLPMDKVGALLKPLTKGAGEPIKRIGKATLEYGLAEIPGELATTVAQNANTAMAEAEATGEPVDWEKYRKELPGDLGHTAALTLASTGTIYGARIGVMEYTKYDAAAREARAQAEALGRIEKAVNDSALRKRDPEAFKGAVQTMAASVGADNVYLSPEVFMQTDIDTEKLAAASPAAAEQIASAVETGADIVIPVAEYLASIGGTPLGDQLRPHVRFSPEGASEAEATAHIDEQDKEAEALLEEAKAAVDKEARERLAIRGVHKGIRDALLAQGKFTPEEADVQASMLAAHIGSVAENLEIPLEEAAARYGFSEIVGGRAAGVGGLEQPAYHGGPHRFLKETMVEMPDGSRQSIVGDAPIPSGAKVLSVFENGRFRLDKIGTGEGAQAYGWGTYLAEARDVGEDYRMKLAPQTISTKEGVVPYGTAFETIREAVVGAGMPNNSIASSIGGNILDMIEEAGSAEKAGAGYDRPKGAYQSAHRAGMDAAIALGMEANKGQLYEVDIPDEQVAKMLDWDKPLSEQSPEVRAALERSNIEEANPASDEYDANERGQQTYQRLMSRLGSDRAASEYLNSLGIPGIKYLDGASRGAGEGTHNFVVFDQGLLDQISGGMRTFYQTEAYHGSPYRFEKFDLSKIGTGEGAQAFGWGQYFAEERDVGDGYRERLTSKNALASVTVSVGGVPLGDYLAGVSPIVRAKVSASLLKNQTVDTASAALEADRARLERSNPSAAEKTNAVYAEAQRVLEGMRGKELSRKEPNKGQLYEVDIPDEQVAKMLDWDKPLSEQSPEVRAALESIPDDVWGAANDILDNRNMNPVEGAGDPTATGEDLYRALAGLENEGPYFKVDAQRGDEAVSKYLNSLGIPGIKYLDGTSRGAGEGTRNFVVFDQGLLDQISGGMRTFYQTEAYTADTITVDGKERPTKNSNGVQIAQTKEGLENFWRWFGDSKVVDAEGKPLVVYHGGFKPTKDNGVFMSRQEQAEAEGDSSFDYQGEGYDGGNLGKGFYFTPESRYAARFGAPMEYYLKTEKPLDLREQDNVDEVNRRFEEYGEELLFGVHAEVIEEMTSEGKHDGVVAQGAGGLSYGADEWMVLESSQIKSASGNVGTFDPSSPNVLEQNRKGFFDPESRLVGLTEKADLSTFAHETGHLFLTNLEELAKGEKGPYREDFAAVLDWFGVSPEDWASMDLDAQRSHHEKFADSYLAYLMKGKAPSVGLQKAFRRFSDWLRLLAEKLRLLNAKVPPEIEAVFDRLLATKEQIDLARSVEQMAPLFESAEEAGMNEEQYQRYLEMERERHDTATEGLTARSMADMRWLRGAKSRFLRNAQREAKDIYEATRKQVTEDLSKQKVYRAINFLRTGELDGVKREGPHWLDSAAIEEMSAGNTADDPMGRLTQRLARVGAYGANGYIKKDGLDPQLAAIDLGYQTAEEMLHEIAEAFPFKQAVEAETEARVFKEHGDIISPRALEDAAHQALRNEAHLRFLATEITALEKLAGKRSVNLLGAKMYGEDLVNRERIGFLNWKKFAAAEQRAGAEATRLMRLGGPEAAKRRAEKAAKKLEETAAPSKATVTRAANAAKAATEAGRRDLVIKAKRNQLIHGYAARASIQAKMEVDKGLKYLRKFTKDGGVKGIPADYLDAIRGLLGQYSLASGMTQKEINARAAIRAKIDEIREATGGVVDPPIDMAVIDGQKNYKELTVGEFRALLDNVKMLEKIARNEGKLLAAGKYAELEELREDVEARVAESVAERGTKPLTDQEKATLTKAGLRENAIAAKDFLMLGLKNLTAGSPLARTLGWTEGMREDQLQEMKAAALTLKKALPAMWSLKAMNVALLELDGFKPGGPLSRALGWTADYAGAKQSRMQREATIALKKILQPIWEQGSDSLKRVFIPELNLSLNKEELLVFACNLGNEQNLQRILDGFKITEAQALAVAGRLTAGELRVVQEIWDFNEGYKPLIREQERALFGAEPEWVAPRPLTLKSADGETVTLKGGYYKIKYDPRQPREKGWPTEEAEERGLLRASFVSSTPSRSFAKKRQETVVGRKIDLRSDALFAGTNEIIHSLAWQEWMIDANKILRDPVILKALGDYYPVELVDVVRKTMLDIGRGDRGESDEMSRMLAALRTRNSTAMLGLSLSNTLLNVLGATNSLVVVGPVWFSKGLAKFSANPLAAIREMREKDLAMRERADTQNREVVEVRSLLRGKGKIRTLIDDHMFDLMVGSQAVVDCPTWWGEYMKREAEGLPETDCVRMAYDAVIQAQGGGQTKDLPDALRGSQLKRVFTAFSGYFVRTHNIAATKWGARMRKQNIGVPDVADVFASYVLLYLVPSLLSKETIKVLYKAAVEGDDDAEKEFLSRASRGVISNVLNAYPIVREGAGAVFALTGLETYGGYSGPAGMRAIKIAEDFAKQVRQGEPDTAFRRSAVHMAGILFKLPSVQINATWDGVQAYLDGETDDPSVFLFGYRK